MSTTRALGRIVTAWLLLTVPVLAQAQKDPPLLGPRLIHYPLRCQVGELCKIDCFQDGRVVVSRARLYPGDQVTLVFNSVFSEHLQPLWLEMRDAKGKDLRTILLPSDSLCDFQGMVIEPFTRPK